MDVLFAQPDLDRLETDPGCTMGLPPHIVSVYRMRMQSIRAADDERDLHAVKGNRCKPLKGKRSHQMSMRLNDQWRLIFELVTTRNVKQIRIVEIVDYH